MKATLRRLAVAAALLGPSMAGPAAAQSPGAIGNNIDASSASPSLAGLNAIVTIAPRAMRKGYFLQAQDTAGNCATSGGANGQIVAFDDGASGSVTVVTLAYASAKGGQGGAIDSVGLPHSGRIRVFGTAGCQVGAAEW